MLMKEFVENEVFDHINIEEFMSIEPEYERNESIIGAVKKYLENEMKDQKIPVVERLSDFSLDPEFGNILYQMSNWGKDIPEVSFMGEKAPDFFAFLICGYVEVHIDELLEDFKTYTIKVYVEKDFKINKRELKSLISCAYGETDRKEIETIISRLQLEHGKGFIHSDTISSCNDQLESSTYCFVPEHIKF